LLILASVNVNYYYVYFSPTPLLLYSTAQSNVGKFLRNGIIPYSLLPTPYSLTSVKTL